VPLFRHDPSPLQTAYAALWAGSRPLGGG